MTSDLPRQLVPFLWHFIRRRWVGFAFMQLCALAWSLDHTLYPYIFKLIVDALASYQGERQAMWTALSTPLMLGAALWLGLEAMYRLQGFTMMKVLPRFAADIRMACFDYTSRHSHRYFADHFAGSIANKLNDLPKSSVEVMTLICTTYVSTLAALVIAAVMMAFLHPLIAGILVLWFSVHITLCAVFFRKCDRLAHRHSESLSTLQGRVVDSLTNHVNVRLFARLREEIGFLSQFQRDELHHAHAMLWYIEKVKLLLGFLTLLGGWGMIAFTLHQWQLERLTTGDVVLVLNSSLNIMLITWMAGLQMPSLFREIGVCKQALSLMQEPHDVRDADDAAPLAVTRGEIVFDRVTFHYLPGRNIFSDKSITIHGQQKIGLVGFSGSGKSTFVNLILRYFDVEGGKIRIDGQNIARVTQDSLRRQIAMIPQDTSLFHRSLRENILCGRPEANEDEMIEAARKAHAHGFISELPGGYEAEVGERGVKLSVGQRQRIAIARAILKNAPILILDEATSALDSVTERHIQDGLATAMQGRTTIVIAHRLSTLAGMDRILVFDKGRIVEDGNHASLLALGGHYATLWTMQTDGFLPDRSPRSNAEA